MMSDHKNQTAVIREPDGRIFHRGLMTWVDRIEYDFQERYGQVWCRGPVDMSGTVALFTALDESVILICAYIDGKPDVAYRKRGDQWEVGDLPGNLTQT
jgi:hypothetical protein